MYAGPGSDMWIWDRSSTHARHCVSVNVHCGLYELNTLKSVVLVIGESKNSWVLLRQSRRDGMYPKRQYQRKTPNIILASSAPCPHQLSSKRLNTAVQSGPLVLAWMLVLAVYIHPATILRLYKAYCLPVLLYGSDLWNITRTELNMIERVHPKILRMIIGLPGRCNSKALLHIMGILSINAFIHQWQLNFICCHSLPLLYVFTPWLTPPPATLQTAREPFINWVDPFYSEYSGPPWTPPYQRHPRWPVEPRWVEEDSRAVTISLSIRSFYGVWYLLILQALPFWTRRYRTLYLSLPRPLHSLYFPATAGRLWNCVVTRIWPDWFCWVHPWYSVDQQSTSTESVTEPARWTLTVNLPSLNRLPHRLLSYLPTSRWTIAWEMCQIASFGVFLLENAVRPFKMYRHGASQVSTKKRDLAIFWWNMPYFCLIIKQKAGWLVCMYSP